MDGSLRNELVLFLFFLIFRAKNKIIMTNKEKLLKVGCKEEGLIMIPPTKLVVPVDVRRLKNWSNERVETYITDILNSEI